MDESIRRYLAACMRGDGYFIVSSGWAGKDIPFPHRFLTPEDALESIFNGAGPISAEFAAFKGDAVEFTCPEHEAVKIRIRWVRVTPLEAAC